MIITTIDQYTTTLYSYDHSNFINMAQYDASDPYYAADGNIIM